MLKEENDEINIAMMGEVQTEILKRIFRERYNLEASFDHGSIVYKETIARKTEGVGHYEPLRHYANAFSEIYKMWRCEQADLIALALQDCSKGMG